MIESRENSLKLEKNPEIYTFEDGEFSFWEAQINSKRVVFRVKRGDNAANRALEKGVPAGSSVYPASEAGIQEWLSGHPKYPVIEAE